MTQYFEVHPQNPQLRLLRQAAVILKKGGVIVYPTDSAYALGCMLGDKKALERIREIRGLAPQHNFTLVCRDLSELSIYARVSNEMYRVLRSYTPGPYTFILEATSDVPRRLLHPKRKSIGLRVPDHPVTQALLDALDTPLMSSSLILPGAEVPLIEPHAMRDILGNDVDLIIDAGNCGLEPTTVLDLREESVQVRRRGKGDVSDLI